MKKLALSVLLSATALLSVASEKPTKTNANSYKVASEESTLKWHAKKVTGEHYGIVKFQDGVLTENGGKLTGGEININMTTIDATDLTGEWHDKLVGHLKSDDFFSVDKHNTARLVIKSAEPIKGAKPGSDNYTVKADLTIKGITNEISFPAMVVVNKGKIIANANFDIDRTLYDIRYGSGKFFEGLGDKAIDDKFNIKVRLVASK